MLRYLLRRVPSAVLTVLVASVAIFACIRLMPGDPASTLLGEDATDQALAQLRSQMGLDRPAYQQYLDWVLGLVRGDLGTSLINGTPITELLGRAFVPTLQLAVAGMIVMVGTGLALGIAGSLGSDRVRPVVQGFTTLIYGTPEYVVAVLGVLVFAVGLDLLPAGGRIPILSDPEIAVQYFILPAVGLGTHSGAVVARFLQSSLDRTLGQDFIDAARAKGISTARLVWRHALPNAMPSVLVILGIRLGHLLGGTVVIEAIFSWHGLGQILVTSVTTRDYRIVQDLVMYSVVIFVLVQIATDLMQAALDPRLRESLKTGVTVR